MELSKRQLQLLRRLRDEGDLDMETLHCTDRSMEPMYLNGLIDGYFKQNGATRDDRYWSITPKGVSLLSGQSD